MLPWGADEHAPCWRVVRGRRVLPMNDSEFSLSNRAAGFGIALWAVLVFVAWANEVPLWLAIPLTLLFSLGISAFIDSFDKR